MSDPSASQTIAMSATHHHHHGHGSNPTPETEPPAEPGYPEHPEVPHPAGHLPGPSAEHAGHAHPAPPDHDGHAEHDAHRHESDDAHAGHRHASRSSHGGHESHAAHAGHDAHAGHGGHDKHAGHSVEMFRDRFWITLALTLPTLVWGHMLQDALGYAAPRFPGSHWIPPVFGTAVFLYGGVVFLRGAVQEIRDRLPGMMTLISLAITVAFGFSLAVTLGFPGMPLWEELATLVTIMVLGHWIEMRSINQAQGALKELAKLLPSTAVRVIGDRTEEVPVSELEEGDVVLVRPGASVPADGAVVAGESSVNEAMITGESRPVKKRVEDAVIAGTTNGEGSLRLRVTGTGERTALAGIMRLVEQAQTSRSRAQALADRAAYFLTIAALLAGAATLAAWLALRPGDPAFAVERMVTVLVIACPHALGLAVPLVVAISTTLGARGGLLVRDRRGLEEARSLDAVVFDKTGTLTLGEQRVVDVATVDGVSADDALRLAAAVERDSEHPVARAFAASAEERGMAIPSAEGFEAIPGHGVRAVVEGRVLHVGGPNLLRREGIELPPALREASERAAAAGRSAVYLIDGARAVAAFATADAVRPESAEAVRRLHENGIEVAMLTGDSRAVAESVARELGIDTVFAEVLPGDKAEKVREMQAAGKRVAMVGDGVNDAPALLTADVGIAIGAGTDVAVEAGDVVLVRSDPRDVARIVELSKATYRKMVQNLWWAAGYNIVAVPLAAGVAYSWGIVLSPAVGAVLMSLSTVIVAANAQLLRRTPL
jgi:P-type Cu2+ transporter